MKKTTLRWRLILLSGSLALGMALILTVLLHFHSRNQLLQQLEKSLEWKCDEVITILKDSPSPLVLKEFLFVETNYRSSPHTYFYQVWNPRGEILARSENLGDVELRIPETWNEGRVHFRTEPHPFSNGGERILLRSERLELEAKGQETATYVIQTAASLVPLESAVGRTLRNALLVTALSLTAVFFLLWFVTTRSLRPVSAMTRRAARITATNLRERLPLTGRGDELDELASVLNDMLDRLGESLRQMEQFSSNVAHGLRTPLTWLRGELDLILLREWPDAPRAHLEAIQGELERLSGLCRRLLLLGRLDQETGGSGLLDESVNLEEIVSELLEQMAPLAHDRGVELRDGAIQAVYVRGSRALLVEALLNLLDNAIRCTPKGSYVSVSIETAGDVAWLSVQDGGPGVPVEERERIFQRFYRIPRAAPGATDDGFGLGLAIVKGIAQAHGGRVEFVEAPEGGSVFRLAIPTHPA